MREKITRKSLTGERNGKTDWARVDALTECELERSIAADPDADVAVDWTKARLVMPRRKESVHLRIDPDVLTWPGSRGKGI